MTTNLAETRLRTASSTAWRFGLMLAGWTVFNLGGPHAVLAQAQAAAPDPDPQASTAGAEQHVDAEGAGTVNLNSASAEELERLPGIGPARARAILELRAKLTRFSRLEELLRVKGIGRATFRKLRPWLALNGPTTLRASVGRTPKSAADTR